MSKNFRKTRALIDLNAVRSNLVFLKSQLSSKNQFFCPMVKSNAYGHGDIEVAKICDEVGVSGVGVALLEEGIRLRSAGIQSEIFVFGPILDDAVSELLAHRLIPVIGQWPELEVLSKITSENKSIQLHLKFNTGMHRLGFAMDQGANLLKFLKNNSHLKLTGICSHLACGDDVGLSGGHSEFQISNLIELENEFREFQPQIHMWNSAGWFSWIRNKSKLSSISHWGVRPGIAVYGVQPSETFFYPELKPAMELLSEIVTIQRVNAGQSVSYGAKWTAKKDSIVGVVPIGYADGYSRSFSSRSQMIVGGKKVPILGTVCMDYTMLDLTDLDIDLQQDLGKEVVILGMHSDQKITAEDLAKVIDTIPYEIITCIGRRVPREFKDHK